MRSIGVLLINGEPKNKRDVIKIVEDASSYFPTETWDDVKYFAKLMLEHDVTIATGGESFGAFLFEKLTRRILKIKHSSSSMNLLLGITPDPIVVIYYFLDGRRYKKTLHLVHDYVDEGIGVVSLFRVNEGSSSKVVAHGLGHNRGLRHHLEPIDFMYTELLRTSTLQVEGFCKVCMQKLTENRKDT